MQRRPVALLREAHGNPPWLDTAVSWELLQRAAAPGGGESLRLFRPARVLAFGPMDRLAPGYGAARAAAEAASFAPVDRIAGGRAAVFHEKTLAFAWTIPDPRARAHIHERFQDLADLIALALRSLGIDARIGPVDGEYCPGAYSVNARGARKLMGVGQRVLPRAAHVGGVLVIDGADLLREALAPVYEALALDWRPGSAGSVAAEIGPVTWDTVANAVANAFRTRFELDPQAIDPALIERARALGERFAGAPPGAQRSEARS